MPHPINMNLAGPVNDNSRSANMSHRMVGGGSTRQSMTPKANTPSHFPQASSLPGVPGIIHDVSAHGTPQQGIPGIIATTTTSPETRARLVGGIIEQVASGRAHPGPVSEVQGHDATAYNAGMAHIRGSPFGAGGRGGEGGKADLKVKNQMKGGPNPGHA
jgi:hypothetical protein